MSDEERRKERSKVLTRELLYRHALKARSSAYAPVTGIKFGAALITKKGSIHVGANIEEWSLTLTRHAEMIAIDSMLITTGGIIEMLVVVGDPKSLNCDNPIFPCGLCRQYISQFATPETIIVAGDLEGHKRIMTLELLIPNRPFKNMVKGTNK